MKEETILNTSQTPEKDPVSPHPAPGAVKEQDSFSQRLRWYEAIKDAMELI